MFLSLVLFVALQVAGGSEAVVPDVKNFKPVLSKELEFRIDDYKTAFVGRVVDYQNPDDPNEFVRVYYRQVALISERAQLKGAAEEGGPRRNLSNLNYHRKQETEALGRVQQEADAFAYVQWRTVRDARTGQDIRAGSSRAWLLDQRGSWVSDSGQNILSAPLSEPSNANLKKQVLVGIKFTLGDGAHIVRIDQDDIPAQVKEVANEPK